MTVLENPMRLLAGDNTMRQAMSWAAIFAVCWAGLELVLGAQLQAEYSLLQIVWCRYVAHLCVVMLVWGWRSPKPVWNTSRPVFQIARSVLMVIMPCSFVFAVQRGISADFIWSIFWVAPLLIVLFASWLLKERPPLAVVIAGVVGAVAAAAIFGHLRPPSLIAIAFAVAVAGSFSLYVVMTRSLRGEALASNLFYTAVAPVIILAPAMLHVWKWPDLHDAIVLVSIGVVGFLALLTLDEACRIAPAWSSAGALFIQAFCVAVVVAVAGGVAPGLRVELGMATLVAIFAILWFQADRFMSRRDPQPSKV